MAQPLFGYRNNITGAAVTNSGAAAGLDTSQWQSDQGSPAAAWQTVVGSVSAWATIDSGSDTAQWRAFLLARTNLTSAATVRWRVGGATAIMEPPTWFDLDCRTGAPASYPAGWNFARASSASFVSKTGHLVIAGNDVPRFDYSTRAGASAGGLLLEESRTNLFLNTTAPVTQSFSLSVGTYTASLRGAGVGSITIQSAGAVCTNLPATLATPASLADVAVQTFTVTTAGSVSIVCTGLVGQSYVQLEAGAFETSHIPSGSTPGVRAADQAWISGLNYLAGGTNGLTYAATAAARVFPGASTPHFFTGSFLPANGDANYAWYQEGNVATNGRNSVFRNPALAAGYAQATAPLPADGETSTWVAAAANTGPFATVATGDTLQQGNEAVSFGAAIGSVGIGMPPTNPYMAVGCIWILRARAWQTCLSNGQITALANTNTTLDPAFCVYDSGTIPAGVAPGFGQSVVVAPSAAQARYARVDISDPGNPDGFLNIPLAYAGPAWQPVGYLAQATTFGRDNQTDQTVTRGGQEFPLARWQRRRADCEMDGIRTTEIQSDAMPLDSYARTGGNVLLVPDPASPTLAQEAIYGIATPLADFGFPYGGADRRSWKLRVTERL